ncbi:MAG: hypothetical protein MUE88_00010 [Flavobacteriales bacterium]|nr:hypothetical protein [Flavobacteriales bacterium]
MIDLARKMVIPHAPVHLDLSHCRFLSPLLICGAAALVKDQQERGVASQAPATCLDPQMRSYLELIRFPTGYSEVDASYDTKRLLALLRGRTYVPLITFPVTAAPDSGREDLIQAVEDLMVRQCGLRGQMLMAVKYLISELVGNISYHAGHGTGFLFAQYYPNGHYLDLAIADTGQGLRASYIASPKHEDPGSDPEALRMALEGRSTKDQAVSRGYGIRTSRRMLVEGLGGSFFFWSGDALLLNNATRDTIYELKDGTTFPGCFLALRVPTIADPAFNVMSFVE